MECHSENLEEVISFYIALYRIESQLKDGNVAAAPFGFILLLQFIPAKIMEFLANAKRRVQLKKINFFYGFRPIQYTSRIFGLWAFTIECDPSGMVRKFHLRPCDILWAIFTIALYLTATCIFIRNIMDSKILIVLHFGFYIIRVVGLVTAALTIVMNVIHRNELIGMLRQFADFDNDVSHCLNCLIERMNLDFFSGNFRQQMLKFNVYFNYKHERLRAWLILGIQAIALGTLLTASLLTIENRDLVESPGTYLLQEFYPYCLRLFVWIVILTTFIVFMRNLYDRFVALNCLLR